ncbi:hypothetical protein STRDD11_00735 [Streptococcus sp. DD11]|nr:hypothetical protein STRDD11_00735 [Streptococcus sp. DD11]
MLSLLALSGRNTSRRLRPVTAKGGGTAIMGVCLSLFAALGQ